MRAFKLFARHASRGDAGGTVAAGTSADRGWTSRTAFVGRNTLPGEAASAAADFAALDDSDSRVVRLKPRMRNFSATTIRRIASGNVHSLKRA